MKWLILIEYILVIIGTGLIAMIAVELQGTGGFILVLAAFLSGNILGRVRITWWWQSAKDKAA